MFGALLISAIIVIKFTLGTASGIYLEEECDRIRRPIHELPEEELMLYVEGLHKIRENGKYQIILDNHAMHVNIHRGSSFFFWHTYYVWEVETQIRALGGKFKCFALPYYDWTIDAGHESAPFILNTVFGGDGNPQNNYCLDGELWSVENWPIKDSSLCADTEDVSHGCCLKRHLSSEIKLPSAEEVSVIIQSGGGFRAVSPAIILQHQQVHWMFGTLDEYVAMASGYSPDDPIFMMLHGFTAYLRGLWATCSEFGDISADTLEDYPDAYTAYCGHGYENVCGPIELDEKYDFDLLKDQSWSITSEMDITPRMLWDFADWGVVYDIGTFYERASLHLNEACPPSRLFGDNKWFLPKDMSYLQSKSETQLWGAVNDSVHTREYNYSYYFLALLFAVILMFVCGCLWSRFRNINIKKDTVSDEHTSLLNDQRIIL